MHQSSAGLDSIEQLDALCSRLQHHFDEGNTALSYARFCNNSQNSFSFLHPNTYKVGPALLHLQADSLEQQPNYEQEFLLQGPAPQEELSYELEESPYEKVALHSRDDIDERLLNCFGLMRSQNPAVEKAQKEFRVVVEVAVEIARKRKEVLQKE